MQRRFLYAKDVKIPLVIFVQIVYNILTLARQMRVPQDMRAGGSARLDAVNHVRRGTEQH